MTFEKYVVNIDFYVGETGISTQTLVLNFYRQN